LIPLGNTDIGRPISHFATELKEVKITEYAQRVLKNLAIIEDEVSSRDSRIFKMRLLPYRTTQNVIDGVVITFSDITAMKKIEQKLRRATAILTESIDPMILLDFNGKVMAWNKGAFNQYGYTETEALKMTIFDIIPEGDKPDELTFISQVKKGSQTSPFNTQRMAKDGRIIDVTVTATLFKDGKGKPVGIATTEKDLSILKENGIS
jgi:two-component system CheB/CheR fusion protein